MFRPYPVFIGLRYTAAKRKNHFISFISMTSMLGLMLGVCVLITVLSVMNGFDRELQQRILGMVPHATVRAYTAMDNWQELDKVLTEQPKIIAAAPYLQAEAMVTHQGQVSGIMVNGIDPEQEAEVSIIQDHMQEGTLSDLDSGAFEVIIGEILARSLRVGVGDKVTIVFPEAAITPAGVFPRMKRFTVAGIFAVGAELDASLIVTHMDDLAKVMRIPGKVSGMRIKVEDLFEAPRIAWDIATTLGGQYYATDWTRTHGNLFQAIKMEKTMIGLLLMMIVAVAAFNIVSTLVMVVTDKKADIAILRTIGAKPGDIMAVFVVQGAIIGVVGNIVGTIAGVLLALNVSDIIKGLEKLLGHKFLDANVYFISYLPSQLLWSDVVVICGAGLVMSLAATIYPAYRASKVDPADALRYE
ncbi:outer membrane-specific lipoprotein transporter subunit LolE [Oleiphilus messinensis]|uniref:Outer membrane-specific lipoprotein transporter subunit LolE n=1 Tax=Oleiphilus messinensis TaxID=141451 RepID=A0A1Y0I9S7_9GAMM|nr:lipoprotein-releasing ABC transporter permease subunit [Oleiphilus messinensis]ARU56143.1 outer membrane-specific lipoprotein transporter subunit LolE [Oleiphilus messinensis]